jgi:hypothetical protein
MNFGGISLLIQPVSGCTKKRQSLLHLRHIEEIDSGSIPEVGMGGFEAHCGSILERSRLAKKHCHLAPPDPTPLAIETTLLDGGPRAGALQHAELRAVRDRKEHTGPGHKRHPQNAYRIPQKILS